jgi:hypothetical protein
VGVSELALNDYERNAFVRHLDRVRVAQLMRREPAPVAGDRRVPVLYPPRAARSGTRSESPANS